jgi:hypothetical protein
MSDIIISTSGLYLVVGVVVSRQMAQWRWLFFWPWLILRIIIEVVAEDFPREW